MRLTAFVSTCSGRLPWANFISWKSGLYYINLIYNIYIYTIYIYIYINLYIYIYIYQFKHECARHSIWRKSHSYTRPNRFGGCQNQPKVPITKKRTIIKTTYRVLRTPRMTKWLMAFVSTCSGRLSWASFLSWKSGLCYIYIYYIYTIYIYKFKHECARHSIWRKSHSYTHPNRFGGVPKLAKSTHHKETTNQQKKTYKGSANSTGSPLGQNAANVLCFDLLRRILLG